MGKTYFFKQPAMHCRHDTAILRPGLLPPAWRCQGRCRRLLPFCLRPAPATTLPHKGAFNADLPTHALADGQMTARAIPFVAGDALTSAGRPTYDTETTSGLLATLWRWEQAGAST